MISKGHGIILIIIIVTIILAVIQITASEKIIEAAKKLIIM